MAYMRGNYYIWDDGKRLHLWAKDGHDNWEESGWANGDTERGFRDSHYFGPSGVSIPTNVMDAFVVMRFAELLELGALPAVITNAAQGEIGRNFGGDTLRREADAIREALKPLFEKHSQTREEHAE